METKTQNEKDLENILKSIPGIRKIINTIPLQEFKDNLRQKIISYTFKDGSTLEQKAIASGRGDDFAEYVNRVVEEKYSSLYSADYVLSQIEHTVLGIGGKNANPLNLIKSISMKFSGRTVLLPAYIAVYAVHKSVDEVLGKISGLYSKDLKGGLTYALDDLIRQTRTLGDMAGITSVLNKFMPGAVEKILPAVPQRIEQAAIRDVIGWVETGKDPSPGYQQDFVKILDGLKGLKKPLGELLKYNHNKQNYSSDHLPAYMVNSAYTS